MRPVLRLALLGSILASAVPSAVAQYDCSGVSPTANTALKTVVAVNGLTQKPLFVTSPPGDVNRLFVVEQNGYIRLKKRGAAANAWTTFLDIQARVNHTSNEMGLLGLAFPPDYATTGYFFVDYTGTVSGCASGFGTIISRFTVTAGNPDTGNAGSELKLLQYCQPENNHNGGWITFGPDGYLYIAAGDGGGGGDVHGACGNGQNRGVLLGKLLRIDVRGLPNTSAPDCGGAAAPYRVPNSNPFRDGAGGNCDEIFAYGLRNPWRDSIDALTGDWYIADVGQGCWEEVNYVPSASAAGRNFGWRQMEGTHCYNSALGGCNPATANGCTPPCNDPSLTKPVLDYAHANGACSITGGYVYRGCKMPKLTGTYFYGDYCAGFIRSFTIAGGAPTNPQDWTTQLDPLGDLAGTLTSFGVDGRGELYVIDQTGQVLLVTPPFPDLEVSAPGAANSFLPSKAGPWTWEDLAFWTGHPVSLYRVYRGVPNGLFTCIFKTTTTSWTGDPSVPAAGTQYAYLVTAVSSNNQETSPGTSTSGTPRQLSPLPCP